MPDLLAEERFQELVEYKTFLKHVKEIHFPVFQSDMTPADFLAMLKTVSNICKKCHDLGDATVGVPLYSLVRDLCISGGSTKIDISSFFLQELIDAATAPNLQGLPLLISSETDESFRSLKELIDRILTSCPKKVCVFFMG